METSDSNKQDQTSETDENNQTAADKTQDQDVARDEENGFALRFTEALLKQKKEGENLIASPYSAWLPLAALVNGCSGATQEQLLKVIGEAGIDAETLNQRVKAVNAGLSQEERRKSYEEYGETFESPLKIANALFVQKDAAVNQTFEQLFSDNYDGKLFSVDFSDSSAANAINSWASEKTDGKDCRDCGLLRCGYGSGDCECIVFFGQLEQSVFGRKYDGGHIPRRKAGRECRVYESEAKRRHLL